jgi:tRNA G10  N-methylase Trm11
VHQRRLLGEPDFGRLAAGFILQYTNTGDLVLDPFAGSGATIQTAVGLGRRGLGIEIISDLAEAAQKRLGVGAVMLGDARRMGDLGLPIADLVVTSPPFMTVTDHPQNPLSGYRTLDGEYAEYLTSLRSILIDLAARVRSGGRIVLDVWNFWHGNSYTPLADDVQWTLTGVVPLEHIVEIDWAEAPQALVNDRCLVYRVE